MTIKRSNRRAMRALSCLLAVAASAAIVSPRIVAADTPSPSPSPQGFIPFRLGSSDPSAPPPRILYVIATGGDAATAQKIVGRLANQLQVNRAQYAKLAQSSGTYGKTQLVSVVPEPSWGIADYIAICRNSNPLDKNGPSPTAGAVIAYVSSVSQYTLQHILYGRTNLTDIVASLAYSKCSQFGTTPPLPAVVPVAKHQVTRGTSSTPFKTLTDYNLTSAVPSQPNMQPYIQFETTVLASRGKANVITVLPVVGALLSVASIWSVFTPSITKSTQNVVTFPTPSPGLPLPPGGFTGTSTTSNSKTTNPAQFSSIGTGILGNSLTYESGAYSVSTGDLQGIYASGDLVAQFLGKLRCPWGDATPSPAPQSPPDEQKPDDTANTPACLNILRGDDVRIEQTGDWDKQSGGVAVPPPLPSPSSTPI